MFDNDQDAFLQGKKGGGLSGGWRGFSIDMELCAGDAVLFEYLGLDPAGDDDDQGEQGPARLLATINRAIPLEENPNRVVDKPPPKGPSVVAAGGASASSADGKPKMRRTTQIVKRENKLRNAILAGNDNFSYAAARTAAAAAGEEKEAAPAASNGSKGKRASKSAAADETAASAPKKAKGVAKKSKANAKTKTKADPAKGGRNGNGNATGAQGNGNGKGRAEKRKERGVIGAVAAKKPKSDKALQPVRLPKAGDRVDVEFVSTALSISLSALHFVSLITRFCRCRCFVKDVGGVVESFCGTVKAKPRPQKEERGSLEFRVFFEADGETVWVPFGSDGSRTWSFAA